MRSFFDKIETFYYNIYYGIKNLIIWLPIIWSDRQFDWDFIVVIFEKKLRLMSASASKDWHVEYHDRDSKRMLICAELLKRIRADDPEDLAYKQHEARMKCWESMFARYFNQYLRRWWT